VYASDVAVSTSPSESLSDINTLKMYVVRSLPQPGDCGGPDLDVLRLPLITVHSNTMLHASSSTAVLGGIM